MSSCETDDCFERTDSDWTGDFTLVSVGVGCLGSYERVELRGVLNALFLQLRVLLRFDEGKVLLKEFPRNNVALLSVGDLHYVLFINL